MAVVLLCVWPRPHSRERSGIGAGKANYVASSKLSILVTAKDLSCIPRENGKRSLENILAVKIYLESVISSHVEIKMELCYL